MGRVGLGGVVIGGAVEAGKEEGEEVLKHREAGADDAKIGLNIRPCGTWNEGP